LFDILQFNSRVLWPGCFNQGLSLKHFYHDLWPVFYEDNHLLVVYKPAGLIMQRDHKNKANLLDLAKIWIKKRYGKPGNVFIGMVHRLDGPVAGVVVLARTSKAAARLSAQIREGGFAKRYLAVVQGRPSQEQAHLKNELIRDGRKSRIVKAPAKGSQTASLLYRTLASCGHSSLLDIDLETGRRHQIRIQLAHLGCPILGDVNYGAANSMPHGRIALLARQLTFDHPTQKEPMTFRTPVPKDWPWPGWEEEKPRPLWAIEEYEQGGLRMPIVSTFKGL
jgi:23S rRNA pseudouridine1911/1915/1917 synthase